MSDDLKARPLTEEEVLNLQEDMKQSLEYLKNRRKQQSTIKSLSEVDRVERVEELDMKD